MKAIRITPAEPEDLEPIQQLLIRSDLPSEDVAAFLADFLVARLQAQIIGVVGLEVRGSGALLRSLAVAEEQRGTGLGKELTAHIVEHAQMRGVRQLGLLTTTAEKFFAKRGFQPGPKNEAPHFVKASREYRDLCPSSAVFMKMDLE